MEFKLIIKKLNNTLTKDEAIVFDNWYNESKVHQDYFLNVATNYQKDIESVDKDVAWSAINKKLVPKNKNNGWKYAVAASIVLLISVGYYFSTKENSNAETNMIVNQKSTIKIGTDKATLTLEDGSTIALEKGKGYNAANAKSNGEKIVYKAKKASPEIAYNTLTIPRGGQFFIELADGTKVWLNSESQLKYPVTFIEGETRIVELLYGEAYFEVTPSTQHHGSKFKVLTQVQEVEVLGTEFNIKAYRDEASIYTTLVEGKISLEANNQKEFLKPRQQSTLNSKNISLAMVDVYNEIAWKDGVFSFDDMSLKNIMKVLSRWYDIDVRFENNEIENTAFNGILRKKQPLEDILNTIKNTNSINYEIKDKTIIFK
ncbi:DUF4974 domain-containing protein [Aureibaculum sp. 2210JD6-5]|uniref:FecR family protein n=1 Tax=Aureibaculum sp. 2210JD6-5 TaxID=3103957 RepID=UPI002AADD621|nr:FecR domain-containing protein [Aureibaculum sp. 2210JD6-5]MDY7394335.1 DUF4974 domain-containing protein [Aureibaculum sp. 2210JD6-5]